ncbi:MAG TPA: cytochrome P450 [Thermoleophilaceae bacterium]
MATASLPVSRAQRVESLPPGPRLPRAVQTAAWIVRPMRVMERCRDRYGDSFTIRIADEGGPWVLISHPDHVREVFTGGPDRFHAGEANRIVRPVLGSSSILVLDESAHLRQRKLMLPSFHGERLQGYRATMADVVERHLERWPLGSPAAARPRMQEITLEVIMRTVFGVEEDERLERLRAALVRLLEWTTLQRRLFLAAAVGLDRIESSRRFGFRDARDAVDELVLDEIARRRSDPGLAERSDVLSLLLQARNEDGRPMTDREVRDELITLLAAGHETTATSLAWALERLARHPAAVRRLEEELAAGEEAYLDAVVQETLRLRPVLAIVLRKLTEPTELGGRTLPAGTFVAPCIYLVHRRPDLYPDPEEFRPERFLESPPGTYTWIPFGGGIRRCLGASFAQLEMKVVLSTLLRRARLRPTSAPAERVVRRAITFAPGNRGEVVLDASA